MTRIGRSGGSGPSRHADRRTRRPRRRSRGPRRRRRRRRRALVPPAGRRPDRAGPTRFEGVGRQHASDEPAPPRRPRRPPGTAAGPPDGGDRAQRRRGGARYGGLETDEAPSPFAWSRPSSPTTGCGTTSPTRVPAGAPPILLVPPLMLTTEVWDISPRTSAVGALHARGHRPWVVDFGHPDRDRAASSATSPTTSWPSATRSTGSRRPPGRTSCSAATRRAACSPTRRRRSGGARTSTRWSPSAPRSTPPRRCPSRSRPRSSSRLAGALIDSGLLRRLALPGWAGRLGFKLLTPAKSVQGRLQFLLALHDRDALLPRERQRRFLEPRAGRPGPARRSRSSSSSSSGTTGCSRAGSSSTTGWSPWPTSTCRSSPSSARPTPSGTPIGAGHPPRRARAPTVYEADPAAPGTSAWSSAPPRCTTPGPPSGRGSGGGAGDAAPGDDRQQYAEAKK